MAIGRDLLDVPFAELVRDLAVAIADGQAALDRNSLDTLRELATEQVDVLTDIVDVISPEPFPVTVPDTGETVTVTGAKIESTGSRPVRMTMLQAGLFPTFYQFTEAVVEVRISITLREEREGTSAGRGLEPRPGPFALGFSRAYASPVDYRTSNAYSYQAQGSSLLRAIMRPVPPPARLQPTVTTVNNFTQPATVIRSPS